MHSSLNPVNENWFHVVGTFDGIMLTLYLDGQFIESVNAVGRYTPGLESQQKSFNIGNRGGVQNTQLMVIYMIVVITPAHYHTPKLVKYAIVPTVFTETK